MQEYESTNGPADIINGMEDGWEMMGHSRSR